jgi:hypothetical protein
MGENLFHQNATQKKIEWLPSVTLLERISGGFQQRAVLNSARAGHLTRAAAKTEIEVPHCRIIPSHPS